MLTGGMFIGIGLAGYQTFNDFYTNFDNSVIGLIFITTGGLIFIFGTSYMLTIILLSQTAQCV